MIVVVVILSILVVVLSYLAYVNIRKAQTAADYCEAYVRFISALFFRFTEARDHIKEVDRLGAFQADDEVGVIFKEIDNTIEDLYEFITKYVNAAETEEDKKAKD